jgi:hypothetical protein
MKRFFFILQDRSSTDLQECIQLFMSKEELDGNEKPVGNIFRFHINHFKSI